MSAFHPSTIDNYERGLKAMRGKLPGIEDRIARCYRNLAEVETERDEQLVAIADSERLLAYMRFVNVQADGDAAAELTESEASL